MCDDARIRELQRKHGTFDLPEPNEPCDELKIADARFGAILEAMALEPSMAPKVGGLAQLSLPYKIRTQADVKDALHARLMPRCELDPLTGCWIWTGAWQDESGLGVIRVAGESVMVSRVAAWVYLGGFDFFDTSFNIVHIDACPNPACWNYEHLLVKGGEWCGTDSQYAGRLCDIPAGERKVQVKRQPAPVVVSDSEWACVLA